jgi:hypothetical protein
MAILFIVFLLDQGYNMIAINGKCTMNISRRPGIFKYFSQPSHRIGIFTVIVVVIVVVFVVVFVVVIVVVFVVVIVVVFVISCP